MQHGQDIEVDSHTLLLQKGGDAKRRRPRQAVMSGPCNPARYGVPRVAAVTCNVSATFTSARLAPLSKLAKYSGLAVDATLPLKIPNPLAGLADVNPVNVTAGHVEPTALPPTTAGAAMALAAMACRA